VITQRVRTAVLIIVTIVWALNFAAGIWVEHYKPQESINGVFMIVVGAVFALGGKDSKGGDSGQDTKNSGGGERGDSHG
jgi:hypothetical protein